MRMRGYTVGQGYTGLATGTSKAERFKRKAAQIAARKRKDFWAAYAKSHPPQK